MRVGTLDRAWLERFLDHVSQGLIALHLILAIIYLDDEIPLMMAVNLVALAADYIGLRLLKKGRFRGHILTLYCVEWLHLTASAVCVGWSAGLQLPLLGLTALVFLCKYLCRSADFSFLPALHLGAVNIALYILVFPIFFYRPGLLSVSQTTAFKTAMLWSVLVFAFVAFGMVSVLRMISDSERSLVNKAETDELTGLYNRAGYERLCAELDLKTTALVLVDTDKFKGINDRFGHETGDQVLKKIAVTLRSFFRRKDCVCRIGGDEFAVLMLDAGELEDDLVPKKIAMVNRELALTADDGLPYVSVSVGAARGASAEDWTELFKRADAALYQVKKDGGRGCHIDDQ